MLSLADATKWESLGDKAVNRFRPWWEVLTLYCLNGLLMAVLFALAGVTISGTYQISCFPLLNETALDLSTIAYANVRCSRIFQGKYLIYFPYTLFVEWAVLFVIHILWFKLPTTFFLFQELSEVFSGFSSIKPIKYNAKKRQLRNIAGLTSRLTGLHLNENKETTEKIRDLVVHLRDVLQNNNNMFWLYGMKAVFLSASSAVIVIVLCQWLSERQWHASFPCDLSSHIPLRYHEMTCSLPAAPFLYGLMICDIMFALGICVCNLWAIAWLLNFHFFTYKHYRESFGKWQFLVEKPGFEDFCFCLNLTTLTSKDGNILGDIVYSSFKVYQKSQKQAHGIEQETFKARFSSLFYQGKEIAHKLGLKVQEGMISEDSLCHAVAKIVGLEKQETSEAIANEILTNSTVYKDLVDKDLNCPEFEQCIELLKVEWKCPKEFQQYFLMATCNAFSINIVVLGTGSKSWYYRTSNEPSKAPTKYLLFIQPNYYTVTENDPDNEDQGKDNQNLFVSDSVYRNQLKEEAHLSWKNTGKSEYQTTVKSLYPRIISYGTPTTTTTTPEAKQPPNVLSDLFNEMGHKFSKLILNKVYIPGVGGNQPHETNT